MTTTTARQPKGISSGGQFAATAHSEPGIVLTGSRAEFVNEQHLYERELEALAGPDAVIEEKYPRTGSEARRLLKNTRGEADGKIRMVRLEAYCSPDTEPGEHIEIVGPKDGRPIIVDVCSGIPNLKVVSGTAIIRARSNWGNSMDIGTGAEAVIVSSAGYKITTRCDKGGKVTFVCPTEKNRFRPFGYGEILLSTGTDTDRIPYGRPVYEPF
ncbi:hypothetical protein GCM10023063_14900 [Arthrobacter methylotrophus]|uniref:Uncharacterized protein n=1 Tax=Arthrobacter methylotrophus TaxID=121291 RepID=A0ABV5UN13_9MICC